VGTSHGNAKTSKASENISSVSGGDEYTDDSNGDGSTGGKNTGGGTDDSDENIDKSKTDKETETEDLSYLIDMDASYPYKIYVNRSLNRVVVYGLDFDGEYSVPYKGFICSAGMEGHSTPVGTFTITDKYVWREMVDHSYAQYATRIYKGIMFHSVPYERASNDTLEVEEYNKLGTNASLGCIRLTVEDVKWIYDNCPKGTTVVVYGDEFEEFPVTFTETMTISEDDENSGWDPTDPNENNPWKEN